MRRAHRKPEGDGAPARRCRAALRVLAAAFALQACGEAGDEVASVAGGEAPAAAKLEADEVDRLRALGYVDVVEEEDESPQHPEPAGVLAHEPRRVQPGLTYFTSVHDCASHLMTARGEVLRSWRYEPCEKWGNTVLLPSGHVLAIHTDPVEVESAEAIAAARKLLKLSWDGELLWSASLPVHHDVEMAADGRIMVLTYRHRLIPTIHPRVPVRDHFLTELDADGTLREETSLTELLLEAGDAFQLQHVEPHEKDGIEEIDLVHSNSLEFLRDPALAAKHPLYAPSHVLICIRHQDVIAIIDWQTRKLVWSWGQGELSGPHDATLLSNGNILIFDNGLDRKWSRVVEVDPLEERIVWEYKAPNPPAFYTLTRGASQRLPNGNTLITYSGKGRLFEVTRDGQIVWLFNNPRSDEGTRSTIVRARRVQEADGVDGRRFEPSD